MTHIKIINSLSTYALNVQAAKKEALFSLLVCWLNQYPSVSSSLEYPNPSFLEVVLQGDSLAQLQLTPFLVIGDPDQNTVRLTLPHSQIIANHSGYLIDYFLHNEFTERNDLNIATLCTIENFERLGGLFILRHFLRDPDSCAHNYGVYEGKIFTFDWGEADFTQEELHNHSKDAQARIHEFNQNDIHFFKPPETLQEVINLQLKILTYPKASPVKQGESTELFDSNKVQQFLDAAHAPDNKAALLRGAQKMATSITGLLRSNQYQQLKSTCYQEDLPLFGPMFQRLEDMGNQLEQLPSINAVSLSQDEMTKYSERRELINQVSENLIKIFGKDTFAIHPSGQEFDAVTIEYNGRSSTVKFEMKKFKMLVDLFDTSVHTPPLCSLFFPPRIETLSLYVQRTSGSTKKHDALKAGIFDFLTLPQESAALNCLKKSLLQGRIIGKSTFGKNLVALKSGWFESGSSGQNVTLSVT